MVLRTVIVLAVIGCGNGKSPDTDSGTTTDTVDSPTDSGTPPEETGDSGITSPVETGDTGDTGHGETGDTGDTGDTGFTLPQNATLTPGGTIACADPGARATLGPWERRVSAVTPPPFALLAGGGLVVADFNGDDRLDMFVTGEATNQNQYWEQETDGSFTQNIAQHFPSDDLEQTVGGTAVDYDADGDLDLFLVRWELPHQLYRNDGGNFTDVTAGTGLEHTSYKSQSSSWADFDNDGDLDVVVGAYGVKPTCYTCPSDPADPAELYQNNGDGTFTDVSDLIPQDVRDGYQFMTSWNDLDHDGYPELFMIHDFGKVRRSWLLRNNGGTEFLLDTDSHFHPDFEGMGLGVADINGDLKPDLLQTSWKTLSLLLSTSSTTAMSGWQWPIEYAQSRGFIVDVDEPKYQYYGWGAEFGDLDNDGDIDAAANYGFWSYYTPPRYEEDEVWIQDAAGIFQPTAAVWGMNDNGTGRGLIFADFNGDGWQDVLKRELEGTTPLYLSRCDDSGHWAMVDLTDETTPNTHGVGATIIIEAGGVEHVRWLDSGSTSLYTGGPPEVHFGLGAHTTIDRLEIIWSDAERHVFRGLDADQRFTVTRHP